MNIFERIGLSAWVDAFTPFPVPAQAGCVHFPTEVPCNIRVLMLLYSVRKAAFIGFIPNNQAGFVNQFRMVVTRQKKNQAERARGQMVSEQLRIGNA